MNDLKGLAAREAMLLSRDKPFRIIGLCGASGVGKSVLARELCYRFNLTEIALADFLKRILFQSGLSEESLWGPSELRDIPTDRLNGITTRKALLELGDLYRTWNRKLVTNITLEIINKLKDNKNKAYDRAYGIVDSVNSPSGVVISDIRYKVEHEILRTHCTIYRLNRTGFLTKNLDHPSEEEYPFFDAIDLHLPEKAELNSFINSNFS